LRKFLNMYQGSLEEPEEFWAEQARQLDWFRTWDKVLEWKPPFVRWFVGGRLNASHICVDHHAKTWRRSKVAIYCEGEPGDIRVLSYYTLYREVNQHASVLKSVANNTSIGDLTTLEDESSVQEVMRAYQELKEGKGKEK